MPLSTNLKTSNSKLGTLMQSYKWIFIIAGMVAGVFTPWQYQVVAMVALLLGFAACFNLKLPSFQIVLESLFGGLSTGLGLQFLIGFGMKNRIVEMIIVPLLTWLVLRIIFYGVETKYTLHPNEVLTQMRAQDAAAHYFDESADFRNNAQTTASAWGGNNAGMADLPDETGRRMSYEYFEGGEIAMGGPTYGEAVFSNKCAFTGVGPSIVLSENGRYAAMVQPSRNGFGLLITDLQEKRVYQPENPGFWEFDRIENGVIFGRHSPITHNSALTLSIEKAIASAEELPMVQDDGWWVIDYQGREPFTQYKVVTVSSKQGEHKVTFVPDLSPFKINPFLRGGAPDYTVLVDDVLIEFEAKINSAYALWVDGLAHEKIKDGRFLVLPSLIIDFKDGLNDGFSIEKRSVKHFAYGVDEHTYTSFSYGEKADCGNAQLLARGNVLPRSTNGDEAEYSSSSHTSPWDDEEVTYWNDNEQKRIQARTRILRNFEYTVDLDKFSFVQALRNCVTINLVNRAKPENTASFAYQNETNDKGGYSCYQLNTSCGITLENVLHEAIWSHCGRYLAVVYFERPPKVPHKISIIDFETACVKEIAGGYALPSFIWFDKNSLDITHLVGIDVRLIFGPDQIDNDETHRLRLTDPQYADEPYLLLIDGIEQRIVEAEKYVEIKKSKIGYSSGSVNVISQHCMLFAPQFDKPVLQPPQN